jgi:hypothetical protein
VTVMSAIVKVVRAGFVSCENITKLLKNKQK